MATAQQLEMMEATSREANRIIDTEAAARRKKTEKLREARLAMEASQASSKTAGRKGR